MSIIIHYFEKHFAMKILLHVRLLSLRVDLFRLHILYVVVDAVSTLACNRHTYSHYLYIQYQI